jgi:hypothetical protein
MEEFVMTIHKKNEQATLGSNLLTSQEQSICKQITACGEPHSKRSFALLALNEGCAQAQAAEKAGLTTGQVKYWVAKFRKQRLSIFPDTLLDELDVEDAEAKVEKVTEIKVEPVTAKPDYVEDKTVDMEAQKEKVVKKKTKVAKKDKKGKKSEKTKKGARKKVQDKKNKKAKKSKKGPRKKKQDKKNKKAKKAKVNRGKK